MGMVFWLCMVVVFLVIEAVTFNLVSIWFAVGAAAAAVSDGLGFSDSISVLVFAIVSAVTLVVFKVFFAKKLSVKHQPTNADRLIGREALVTEDIDPVAEKGAVEVAGLTWSAKSDRNLKKGAIVKIEAIQGVKLIVRERVNI